MQSFSAGIDVGSTTVKMVVLDANRNIVFKQYKRHNAQYKETLRDFISSAIEEIGNIPCSITVTGSVGMNISEMLDVPFLQEVVAATQYTRQTYPNTNTLIDIGGEDAKIVFFDTHKTDLRMNGNCAGGTGSFIDQMAVLLNEETNELNNLAAKASHLHPIAARCGVFSKTDIQNLISRNTPKSDIAASIFHAVAVQTISSLAHGHEIKAPIMLCGGPLTFLPSLRTAFMQYLNLSLSDFIIPENGIFIPALGCAFSNTSRILPLDKWLKTLNNSTSVQPNSRRLQPLFDDEQSYREWQKAKCLQIPIQKMKEGVQHAVIGIDSGSTTTKIVVTDTTGNLLFSHYTPNNGNPIEAVNSGLNKLQERCRASKTDLRIVGSCSTGYGEELIKTAFSLDEGIIETIAHFQAAKRLTPEVSFVLDIGGQDMKAIFIENGAITRMELNEACSSGCGSFIETFAKTLGYTASNFATIGCSASSPCDLGTRCTVFMNSKVKQVLREGASIADIASGLSYSVIKNCLYKVLKIKDKNELGRNIVLQGGTMRNDAIVRAFELLTGTNVARSDIPELMGAYGCALTACQKPAVERKLSELYTENHFSIKHTQCKGCENRCSVCHYSFANGKTYYSGNKCETIFSNRSKEKYKGLNIYSFKNKILFDRQHETPINNHLPTIGIPRILNMFEEYPFWHTLFTSCGIEVILSSTSTFNKYEQALSTVMSDNICFPAKLVHSHIKELTEIGVNRIFMPYVIYEKREDPRTSNSYNCPIVSGYSDVIRNSMSLLIPIDSPAITFANEKALAYQCKRYLEQLGVGTSTAKRAIRKALKAQEEYEKSITQQAQEILHKSQSNNRITVLLAGRPYHADPLIQHKIAEMITELGADVISDDIVRNDNNIPIDESFLVQQWGYINRILKAVSWCARQNEKIHFVQITSFGCGPDAFLIDEVRDILLRGNKPFTLLKVDDVNNIGSLKLRMRSLIESLKNRPDNIQSQIPFTTTPVFTKSDKRKKIIAPFFSEYISPLLPSFFELAGYDVEILPLDNMESADTGLKYANNEVCYPATLVTGSLIKALQSGQYDLNNTAVAITQTGGQCRATNYVTVVKRALISAGFTSVPVVTLGIYGSVHNKQEGFNIPWHRLLPIALSSVLYTDILSRLYHSVAPREKKKGIAKQLRDTYLQAAHNPIKNNNPNELLCLIEKAAQDFNTATLDKECPRVGIVGEIYLKFNPFSHLHIVDRLIACGIEPVSPTLLSLLTMSFINTQTNKELKTKTSKLPSWIVRSTYRLIHKEIEKFNHAASAFRYYIPIENIQETARLARKIVSPTAQFGEGWLLPGETAHMAENGINNVISLQPFGCIANHIISKGIEKRLHSLYPQLNFLSLDFDSGVSAVNVINRLCLYIDNINLKSSSNS